MTTRGELRDGARILVIRLSALGDVLFGLETVASMKRERPDLQVEFLVEDRHAAILEGCPDLSAVRVISRRGRLARLAELRTLRREHYDVLLDLHGLVKSALVVVALRARRKLGFAPPASRELAHVVYHERVALPDPLPHRAERGLFLLRALGLKGEPAAPRLAVPQAEHPFWNGVARPRVVLHPGASAFAAFKRWPLAKFEALAARLCGEGVFVAVSFGPGEEALGEALLRAAPAALVIDGKALGLLGLAHVFRDADLVIAADTGPLHVAAAAGTRVLALFGPKDVALYGPRWHAENRVLWSDVPCRPCTRRECASPQCVLGIGVEDVAAAIDAALATMRGAPRS
ncbi:MAG: glycosyltransferase family 9 protein [Planctomycetes bacterium]|nr:glycosyltransferase family 9 protein [Planctomycetota bacterium]